MKKSQSRLSKASPQQYQSLLNELAHSISVAQQRAAIKVNTELMMLYYFIGKKLHECLARESWGTGVVERLSRDLQSKFKHVDGLSSRNLRRMKAFYEAYPEQLPDEQIRPPAVAKLAASIRPPVVAKLATPSLPPVVAQIPWAHNVLLLEKVKNLATRIWYAEQTLKNGWSRNMLGLQVRAQLHRRQGKAVNNFARTLPPPQSDLAQQMLKDPYVFDFLAISGAAAERELEESLLSQITRFLLELGAGFAFVGQQVRVTVDKVDYHIDLLFYHVRLHCYVVIDLKSGAFEPEFAGKMNFYLSAVDDQMRAPADQPTIGLILCRENRRLTAEYALRDVRKPIGVAGWQTKPHTHLPKALQRALPTVEQLEQELGKIVEKSG